MNAPRHHRAASYQQLGGTSREVAITWQPKR